jgi:hypothetical protein
MDGCCLLSRDALSNAGAKEDVAGSAGWESTTTSAARYAILPTTATAFVDMVGGQGVCERSSARSCEVKSKSTLSACLDMTATSTQSSRERFTPDYDPVRMRARRLVLHALESDEHAIVQQ